MNPDLALREPDAVIEGQIPIWECDEAGCHAVATVIERNVYLTHATCVVKCSAHRWRGGAVIGTHVRGWVESIPATTDRRLDAGR